MDGEGILNGQRVICMQTELQIPFQTLGTPSHPCHTACHLSALDDTKSCVVIKAGCFLPL